MSKDKQLIRKIAQQGMAEAIASLTFIIVCFAFLFPDLFFLVDSPMGGTQAALKDPTVSWAAFMPAFREFRYELLEHGNVLWSNLRSVGLPLLGNGVQGAPLFPLNLALIWLPDGLYWSVMPITRLILIAWGLYMVSRHVFKLSPLASLIFALLAGFNINMIRWINHPWSNGVLAGVWYLYFSCLVFSNALAKQSALAWYCCGLIISVFAMVTCGFPEASAASAIIAVLLFFGFILTNWSQIKPSIGKRISLILFCHLVGFCLSSIQLFALLEFIVVSEAMELRGAFSSGIYKPEEALSFGLAQFSAFWFSPQQLNYTVFHLGLFGTFFFIRGLVFWLKVAEKPWFGMVCIAMMLLYVVKSLGLSALLEQTFAYIPILAQSHFPLYFPTLFYVGACYFCAIGVQGCVDAYRGSRRQMLVDISVSLIAVIAVLVLAGISVEHFNNIEWHGLIGQFFSDSLFHFRIFVFMSALLMSSLALCFLFESFKLDQARTSLTYVIATAMLVAWVLAELNSTLPKDFAKSDHWSLNLQENLEQTFNEALREAGLDKSELRGNDANGSYLEYGIATINNGVSAIMPVDQRLMRTNLFHTQYEGYWPALKSLKPWSWEAMSANLIAVDITPRSKRSWPTANLDRSINITDAATSEFHIADGDAILYLEGSATGYYKERSRISPWIHFRGVSEEFWVEANIQGQQMLGKNDSRFEIHSKWRMRIPMQWLQENSYEVTLRLQNEITANYADATPFTLNAEAQPLEPDHKFSPSKYADLQSAKFLANTADERLYLYLSSKALPRAYVAKSCMQSTNNQESLDFLRASEAVLQGEVALSGVESSSALFCANYRGDFKRIPILTDLGSSVSLEEVMGPALVVLNDYDYPGWQVTDLISAEKVDIVKANSIFRGLVLPEKRGYKIQFEYQPWWLNWVYSLLLLAACLMLMGWVWLRKTTYH